MAHFFTGFLFIFLDFNLNLGSSIVGLLPDFVGFYFLVKGMNELIDKSDCFAKGIPAAKIGIVYTAVLYALQLFGLITDSYMSFGLSILSTGLVLYVSYQIVQGILEMEAKDLADYNGAQLEKYWKISAAAEIGASLFALLAPLLSVISLIVCFVVIILFLIAMNRSKKMYLGLS